MYYSEDGKDKKDAKEEGKEKKEGNKEEAEKDDAWGEGQAEIRGRCLEWWRLGGKEEGRRKLRNMMPWISVAFFIENSKSDD